MANDKQTILAAFGRMQSGLSNVAGDIRSLKDGIKPGMSQADVDEITAKAEEIASGIESLAAETPEAETGGGTETGPTPAPIEEPVP